MYRQLLEEKFESKFSVLPPSQQKDYDLHFYQKEAWTVRSWGNISQPVGLWFFHSHATHPSLLGEIQTISLSSWALSYGLLSVKRSAESLHFPLKYQPSGDIFHLLWNYWFSWWWLCCLCIATHKYVPNCVCTIYMHTQEVSWSCFCAELLVSQICHFWRNLCLKGGRYGVTLPP